jgi:glycosyltransferase involved in cell wall biosynthesis
MNAPSGIRVAGFLPRFGPGGAELVAIHLANGLAERGYRSDLLVLEAAGEFHAEVSPRVNVVELGSRRALSSVWPLRRYALTRGPQVLFAHLDHISVAALLTRRLAGLALPVVPVVHRIVSRAVHYRTFRERALRAAMRRLYSSAEKIIAVSNGAAADLAGMGVPRDRVRVIYNPAITPRIDALAREPAPLFPTDGLPVILGVGRLTKAKDFPTLIRAFALLRRQRPCRLMIVGDGEERALLRLLISQLGLEADAELPGHVANPFCYMARASVFALSSSSEALPTALIEALHLGIPAVATDCPAGPREILRDGELGRLVPVGDAAALAAALGQALDQRRGRPDHSALRPFTLDASLDRYAELIGEIVEGSRRNAPC